MQIKETIEPVIKVQNEPVNVVETRKIEQRVSIQTISVQELKGKLLFNLRRLGSEMLWNLIQTVQFEISGNVLILTARNAADQELLDKTPSRAKIEESLEEFLPFELQIKLSDTEKTLNAVDQATERIKKIFGDDIVIIK